MFRVAVALAVSIGIGGPAQAAPAWPEVATPPGAQVQTVAADIVFNGKSSRVLRFEVDASSAEVLAFYRAFFGPRRVENRVSEDQVIAARREDHFVTVQLHALAAQRVQGTVMTTRVHGAPSSAVALDTQRLLPAASAVVSTMQSEDRGIRSIMVVGVNRNSAQANREHVVALLQRRGFRVMSEDALPGRTAAISIALASAAEEAAVTITDAGPYRAVLINRQEARK